MMDVCLGAIAEEGEVLSRVIGVSAWSVSNRAYFASD